MAVKIRLARRGRKGQAIYDVIVADARSPRDGRFIEKLGMYNPNSNPAIIDIDNDRALHWVMNGAQPTDTARNILSGEGVMLRKHLQVGVLKGAITQEQADTKYEAWKAEKDTQTKAVVDKLSKSKADARKARLEAEAKVNEARAEAIKQSQAAAVEETVQEIADAEAKAEMDPSLAEDVAEVEEAQEAAATEAPAVEGAEPVAPEAEESSEAEAPAEEAKAEAEVPAKEEKKAEETEKEEEKPAEPAAEAKEEAAEEASDDSTPEANSEEKKDA